MPSLLNSTKARFIFVSNATPRDVFRSSGLFVKFSHAEMRYGLFHIFVLAARSSLSNCKYRADLGKYYRAMSDLRIQIMFCWMLL